MGNHAELLVQLLRVTGWSVVEMAHLLKAEPLMVQRAIDGAQILSRQELGLVLVAAGQHLLGPRGGLTKTPGGT